MDPTPDPFAQPESTTLFLEVFGSMSNAVHDRADAFRLLWNYQQFLHWVTPDGKSAAHDHWSVNDAGEDWSDRGSSSGRLAWYQVELDSSIDATGLRHPLPIPPLSMCLQRSLDRVGDWRLDALQILAPMVPPPVDWGTPTDLQGLFEDGRRGRGRQLRVTIDLRHPEPELIPDLRQRLLDHSFVRRVTTEAGDAVTRESDFYRTFWQVSDPARMTAIMDFPEWSMEAAAWLADTTASALTSAGVRRPVMITVAVDRDGDHFQGLSDTP